MNDGVNVNPTTEKFQYTVYNSQKIYKDNNNAVFFKNGDGTINKDTGEIGKQRYFYYSSEYKKDYITDISTIEYLNNHLVESNGQICLNTDSAEKYYSESLDNMTTDFNGNPISFTDWVKKSYLPNMCCEMSVNPKSLAM